MEFLSTFVFKRFNAVNIVFIMTYGFSLWKRQNEQYSI